MVEYTLLLSNLVGGITGTISSLLARSVTLLSANPVLILVLALVVVILVVLKS